MPCSRHNTFALADELTRRTDLASDREAVVRAAIGRAYYSTYYIAAELHRFLGSPAPSRQNLGSHAKLIDALFVGTQNLGNAERAILSTNIRMMESLLKLRKQADYDVADTIAGLAAIQAVDKANRVASGFEKYMARAKAAANPA